MGIRRHRVLYNALAAGDGVWHRLDSRYEEDGVRSIQVDLSSGDTVIIQGTTVDPRGAIYDVTSTLTPSDITNITTFTASGNGVIAGNWSYIRAVKTGTTGVAKVQGHI